MPDPTAAPRYSTQLIADMRETATERLSQGPISLGYRLGHIQADGRIFRGVVYNKSAVVLHMLRRLIGDEAFFNGLRKFYRDSRFQKAGTDDFRAAFETVSAAQARAFRRSLDSRLDGPAAAPESPAGIRAGDGRDSRRAGRRRRSICR